MSAEGMPQEKHSFAERPLLWITRLVLQFPGTTVLLGILLAVAATLYSNQHLGFRTNRCDLLNPNSDYHKRWLDYVKEFSEKEDVIVVVESADRRKVLDAKRAIASAVEREPALFRSVLSEVDSTKLQGKGLYYASVEELQLLESFLDQFDPVLKGQWEWLNVGMMTREMAAEMQRTRTPSQGPPAEAIEQLGRFLRSVQTSLQGKYESPWPEMRRPPVTQEDQDASQMLLNKGTVGLVLLRLVDREEDNTSFVRGEKGIERLREIVAQVQRTSTDVKIGLTGIPVIEHDEMASSESSMTEVSLVSFLLVSLLFVAGFGSWRHPLLAVSSLMLGTAWSMGYITLSIGHLNILSSAFAVILIGQGIDFSMYYVAEYMQSANAMRSSKEALLHTVKTVGPGVATGAITTAVAFFMAGLTDFIGVAELGLIAGGGILICWIAGLTVLPAMIHLADTRWPHRRMPQPIDVRSWLEPFLKRPRTVLAVTGVATACLTYFAVTLPYDHNLLHLQAKGSESVNLELKLLKETDLNASYALSVAATPEELLANKARFLKLPSVKRVEEIVSRFPGEIDEKRAIVRDISQKLANLPDRVPNLPAIARGDMELIGVLAGNLTGAPMCPPELKGTLSQIASQLQTLSPQECFARLSEFQQRMADDLLTRLHMVRQVSNPEPPRLDDLPKSLTDRFVGGRKGLHSMRIYAKGDIWDPAAMEQFIREIRSVDPQATGNPFQIYAASHQMQRSYQQAALYALAIILPVVFLDFRSFRFTFLAVLPLGLGMAQMFGLMGISGIPLNSANMIVLPLILGIGIDAGVHVVHDFMSQRGPYRINPSTASAVVINTVTNMAGFGSLMIASHRGLQSIGRVLTLGLACCLFTSLIMLPAILQLISSKRRADHDDDPGDASPEEPLAHAIDIRRIDPGDTSPPHRGSQSLSPSQQRLVRTADWDDEP